MFTLSTDVSDAIYATQIAAAYHRRLSTFAAWLNERAAITISPENKARIINKFIDEGFWVAADFVSDEYSVSKQRGSEIVTALTKEANERSEFVDD